MQDSEADGPTPVEHGSPHTGETTAAGPADALSSEVGTSAAVPLGPASTDPSTGGSSAADRSAPEPPWALAPASTTIVPVWGPVGDSTMAPGVTPAKDVHRPEWLWAVVAVSAALIGGLVGGGIVAATGDGGGSTTVKEISAGPALLNGTTNIEAVIDKVLPAIVSIDAKSQAPASQSFLGGTGGGVKEDQGTGMIITSGGEVITNNHVIAGATTITVTLYGKLTSMPATLIDTDPTNDIALLQITGASNLPTANYGNSKNVQVGDAVVAIGNALGLSAGSPTVTQGIISATGRTVQAGDSSGTSSETLTNMFQTDAAINPGNSGGPLVDSSGRVIGMNTAVAASADGSSQAQNIGFAIPSNKIIQQLPALRNRSIGPKTPTRSGYLGVDVETLTSQIRSAYNFVPTQGAVVLSVVNGSPADTAGIRQGDVITSFNGKPVTSADQLATAIQAEHPGKRVTIGLYRQQTQMTLKAILGSSASQ
jgi:S1-C subfamily serine protease